MISTPIAFSASQIEMIIKDLALLRLQADLELVPKYPYLLGKPYPLGRCKEIRNTVFTLLEQAIVNSDKPGIALIRECLDQGATLTKIWGGLRQSYFQNAILLNEWYLDVSNDTVNPNKPRIEVMPLAESGFDYMTSFEQFIHIAQLYWQVQVFRNDVCPALAPFMPMVYLASNGESWLGEANDDMLAVATRSAFSASETTLAQLPDLPFTLAEKWHIALNRLAHNRFLHAQGDPVTYCQRYRGDNLHQNVAFRDQAVMAFLRLPPRVS